MLTVDKLRVTSHTLSKESTTMASTIERKSATSFLIVLSAVYLAASVLATAFVAAEILRNGAEVWSIGTLAGALTATALWGYTTHKFSASYQRVSRKIMA